MHVRCVRCMRCVRGERGDREWEGVGGREIDMYKPIKTRHATAK